MGGMRGWRILFLFFIQCIIHDSLLFKSEVMEFKKKSLINKTFIQQKCIQLIKSTRKCVYC